MQIPLCFALSLAVACLFGSCSNRDDDVIGVSKDDPEMNAAMAKAREALPKFWAAMDNPQRGEEKFNLKVRIRDGKSVEYFWVGDLERKDGKLSGRIRNDPQTVSCVKLGQRISIQDDQVVDWLYMRDGKMVGNYTIKPLLKKMPAQEAAKMKSMMAEPE